VHALCTSIKRALMMEQLSLGGVRTRILESLFGREMSVVQLADELGHTPTATRVHIRAMLRDGLVERAGRRKGVTRPFAVFRLTAQAERLLSPALIPFVHTLLEVYESVALNAGPMALMEKAGRSLATSLQRHRPPAVSLSARLHHASDLLNDRLGARTWVDEPELALRGNTCPLAALTTKHPSVCAALEATVAELIGSPVVACCDRSDRPRCCFRSVG
jgi:predicted ArsR family transcriptional regulator